MHDNAIEIAIEIRPHHGLCAEFFVGKGYSGEFTENMAATLKVLAENNPQIVPKVDTDLICGHCPNNKENCCTSGEKVLRYDKKVLKLCGIAEGTAFSWEEYRRLLREKIIGAGKLKEVCGDCQWVEICENFCR
nr:DUF1284 domain-containing protein [Oscillospiraceae bacterium]